MVSAPRHEHGARGVIEVRWWGGGGGTTSLRINCWWTAAWRQLSPFALGDRREVWTMASSLENQSINCVHALYKFGNPSYRHRYRMRFINSPCTTYLGGFIIVTKCCQIKLQNWKTWLLEYSKCIPKKYYINVATRVCCCILDWVGSTCSYKTKSNGLNGTLKNIVSFRRWTPWMGMISWHARDLPQFLFDSILVTYPRPKFRTNNRKVRWHSVDKLFQHFGHLLCSHSFASSCV